MQPDICHAQRTLSPARRLLIRRRRRLTATRRFVKLPHPFHPCIAVIGFTAQLLILFSAPLNATIQVVNEVGRSRHLDYVTAAAAAADHAPSNVLNPLTSCTVNPLSKQLRRHLCVCVCACVCSVLPLLSMYAQASAVRAAASVSARFLGSLLPPSNAECCLFFTYTARLTLPGFYAVCRRDSVLLPYVHFA